MKFRNLLLSLLTLPLSQGTHREGSQDSCRVDLIALRTAMLDDGRIISSDAGDLTSGGSRHLILGTPTMIWPTKTGKIRRPIELLGFLYDAKGSFRAVSMPSPHAQYARAAYDGAGGWHIVYAEPLRGRRELDMRNADSAALFYAHHDGSSWSRRKQLAVVYRASLHPAFASGLTTLGDHLYFAFPYEREMSSPALPAGNQGLVMLTLRVNTRSVLLSALDTLRTWAAPTAVRVVPSQSQGVTVVIAQDYFRNRKTWPTGLFTAEYAKSWSAPMPFWTDSIESASSPSVKSSNDGFIVTWKSTRPGSTTSKLMTTRKQFGRPDIQVQMLSDVDPHAGYATTLLNSSRMFWLWKGYGVTNSLHAMVGGSNRVDRSHDTGIKIQNFVPLAARLSDSMALVVTGVLDDDGRDAPAAAIVSTVRVNCR
jgi:hypothetical protein